jgi:hypothetical protein
MISAVATGIALLVVALLIIFGINDLIQYNCGKMADFLTAFRGVAMIIMALYIVYVLGTEEDD